MYYVYTSKYDMNGVTEGNGWPISVQTVQTQTIGQYDTSPVRRSRRVGYSFATIVVVEAHYCVNRA